MSRHSLTLLPGRETPVAPEIVIGWDPPLHTFFGYVRDLAIDDGEADPIIFWVGISAREIQTVQDLVRLFEPWAWIPIELRQTLEKDAQADRR
jgi:hypothetical protein